jgi:hypothetical protein
VAHVIPAEIILFGKAWIVKGDAHKTLGLPTAWRARFYHCCEVLASLAAALSSPIVWPLCPEICARPGAIVQRLLKGGLIEDIP